MVDGTSTTTGYIYGDDANSQLVRVDDAFEGRTHTYTYDAGGNLTSHSIYSYTRDADPDTEETVIPYGYQDTGWKDKLTSYNGESFTYDEIGNPLIWRGGMALTWRHGRQLATLTKDGITSTYSYDDGGYRIKKQVGDVVTTYYRNGETVLTEITGEDRLNYLYDANGLLFGFKYNGTAYYYRKNLQGDILGILDNTGDEVVSYSYDAWGRLISCTGSMAESVGQKNPFRYRGYYYDAESGLYYLNSRYYDPVVGRFLNADSAISGVGGELLGYNMYVYCFNAPVNLEDTTGNWPKLSTIFKTVAVVAGTIAVAAACVAAAPAIVGGAIAASTAVYVAGVAFCVAAAATVASVVTSKVETTPTIRKNHRNQSVYIMRNSTSKEVQYVGRTNNPVRRQQEHNRDSNKAHLDPLEVKFTGLTKLEARVMEQVLISAYTIDALDNARREIAAGNVKGFAGKISNVISIFDNAIEDEYLNLMGR